MKIFDLKVGYSCNNHCMHCVIEDNKPYLKQRNEKYDLTYTDIINIIDSIEFAEADQIVLTGGEPTLRKDFVRILDYIINKYPSKHIAIQTNGRLLYKYLERIKNLSLNIRYVIAIHGLEETHNKITNNSVIDDTNNPFKETLKTLYKLKEVYSSIPFRDVARIEIVLSKLNLSTIDKCVDFLLSEGFNKIGISYPHLDGMYMNRKVEAEQTGFSYEEFKPVLSALHKVVLRYPNAGIYFEEVPPCMFREDKVEKDGTVRHCTGEIYYNENFRPLGHTINPTTVKFPGLNVNTDFGQTYDSAHRYTDKCVSCKLYKKACLGTWFESVYMFGNKGFIPIQEGGLFDVPNK